MKWNKWNLWGKLTQEKMEAFIPKYQSGMGKIEIFPLSALLNCVEQSNLFSLYHSDLVPFLFDFLCSSWKWMRLLEWEDSKQRLMTLSHLSII